VIGIKETLRHLSDGKAKECFQPERFPVKDLGLWMDKPWEEELLKFFKAQVPVVPI
jgi:hypothetical protein